MPRQARKKSENKIYHVMLRGINQQTIFEDNNDRQKFLDVISEYKEVSGYKIYAYCLMSNHVHLLIKEENEELGMIFKRICGKYVYWYNTKYKRAGHLFQDRYKSEPVDTDAYLLAVIRYIHQNPVKAGLVKRTSDHKFSSYNEYLNQETNRITDTDFVLGIWNIEEFKKYHKEKNEDNFLDIPEPRIRLTDEQVKELISKVSKCSNAAEFQNLESSKRDKYIQKLKKSGASIRQLSRLTGVSFGVVRKL